MLQISGSKYFYSFIATISVYVYSEQLDLVFKKDFVEFCEVSIVAKYELIEIRFFCRILKKYHVLLINQNHYHLHQRKDKKYIMIVNKKFSFFHQLVNVVYL